MKTPQSSIKPEQESNDASEHVSAKTLMAPFETSVHCFRHDSSDFAYFSRTADLFELSPESAVALRHFESTGNIEEGVAQVSALFGEPSAERVQSDLRAMKEYGLFDAEPRSSSETDQAVRDAYLAHKPRNLMLFLTERCNLKCLYCYEALAGVHDNGSILREGDGKEILIDFFNRSAGRKNIKITFFGGEPLTNWGVFKSLVEFAEQESAKRGISTGFTTTSNLTLLDEEKADFLVEHKFTVMVSIDGDKSTHDANRLDKQGKGTYERVASNLRMLIEKCQAAGIRLPSVRATWVHGNSNYDDIRKHLKGFGIPDQLIKVGIAGYDLDNTDKNADEEEYGSDAKELWQQEVNSILSGEEPSPFLREALQKLDAELSRTEPHEAPQQDLCGVCRNMLAATPSGDLYPCHRYVGMEGFKVGNVSEGGLNTEKVTEYYSKIQDSFKDTCGSCWARHLCKGTCPWVYSGKGGLVRSPRARDCSGIRWSYEYQLAIYSKLRKDPDRLKRMISEE